jgi:hypothetical protein
MNPIPADSPGIAPGVTHRDAGAMIDWLCTAFGLVVQLKAEGEDAKTTTSPRPDRSTARQRWPNPAS